MLTHTDLLELKRWNTPSIFNGWEAVTGRDVCRNGVNLEEVHDFMPYMGPMIGYAVTVVIEPGNREHQKTNPNAFMDYLRHAASLEGPKIVVVHDLDKPRTFGGFWGEVNSNLHRAIGCVGTITDGGVRDLDEMRNAGFKALARRLCVGHGYSTPVRWDCEVEVFGRKVEPGNLIHADKHGFLVIPAEDAPQLLEAVRFMDSLECKTLTSTARSAAGKSTEEILENVDQALKSFVKEFNAKFVGDK